VETRVGFANATLRTQGSELTTEPTRPANLYAQLIVFCSFEVLTFEDLEMTYRQMHIFRMSLKC